jgi:hypothetical protein
VLWIYLAFGFAPDILAPMHTIWPIIPPSVRAAFSDRADKNNLISARVLDEQHRRTERAQPEGAGAPSQFS